MEENFLPVSGSNKTKAAVPDDSLDCALHSHLTRVEGNLLGGFKPRNRTPGKHTTPARWRNCINCKMVCQRRGPLVSQQSEKVLFRQRRKFLLRTGGLGG